MGKKDEYQFDYLDDDRRYADRINSALYHRRQIVKPEELEPDESQMVSTGEKAAYPCSGESELCGLSNGVITRENARENVEGKRFFCRIIAYERVNGKKKPSIYKYT